MNPTRWKTKKRGKLNPGYALGALVKEREKAFNPANISLFGANAVMLEAYFPPHLNQELGSGGVRCIHDFYLGCNKNDYCHEF
jgi:hypothetical protein